jgi:hypothetical protein
MRERGFRAYYKGQSVPGLKPEMLYEERLGDVFRWLDEGQPIEINDFTGLYDQNNTKIYENDVVVWDATYLGQGVTVTAGHGTVVFAEGRYFIQPPAERTDVVPALFPFDINHYNIRVVGNKYQFVQEDLK